MKKSMFVFLKGMAVGSTMLIPGVSGGTMAMILGIYDRLVQAVASFFENWKEHLWLLLLFALGGGTGMLLLARPLLYALGRFPMPMGYFFLGAVMGGIPLIMKKANVKRFHPQIFLYLFLGIALVWSLSFFPEPDAGRMHLGAGMGSFFYLLLAGVIAAVALILPGISISYLLLLLGLYDKLIEAALELQMGILIPMGVGLILGVLLCTKLLERAMKRYPMGTYFLILGFMAGSLPEVYPGIPPSGQRIIALCGFGIGFGAIYMLSLWSKESSD